MTTWQTNVCSLHQSHHGFWFHQMWSSSWNTRKNWHSSSTLHHNPKTNLTSKSLEFHHSPDTTPFGRLLGQITNSKGQRSNVNSLHCVDDGSCLISSCDDIKQASQIIFTQFARLGTWQISHPEIKDRSHVNPIFTQWIKRNNRLNPQPNLPEQWPKSTLSTPSSAWDQ